MEEKYFCSNCKGLRHHTEVYKIEERGADDDAYFQWYKSYSIIKCNGCDNHSFLKVYGNTEMRYTDESGMDDYYYDQNVYPPYLKQGDAIEYLNYLPSKIKIIYVETIAALKSDSSILAAGGLRAIIEAVCQHLKIEGRNLEERINGLSSDGHLILAEAERLHAIRFLGNDALHEIEKPKENQLYLLLDIVNHLLSNLFINERKLKGRVEMKIKNFDDFVRLVQNNINEDMVGKELALLSILGKSKRLIAREDFAIFEKEFVESIKSKKVKFARVKKNGSKNYYEITEKPVHFLFGIN